MKKLFGKHALTFAVTLLAASGVVAAMSMRGEPSRQLRFGVSQRARTVRPAELASWIIAGNRDFAVIDMRGQLLFEQGHVRGAVSCGTCHRSADEGRKGSEDEMFVDLSKKLVLYTATGNETVELPKLLAKNPRLYTLEGGYAAWQQEVLAPTPLGGVTNQEQLEGLLRREAMRAFFAGERTDTAAPAVLPLEPIKRKGPHQAATAREGC